MDFDFCLSNWKRIEVVIKQGVNKQWSMVLVLGKVEEGMMGLREET